MNILILTGRFGMGHISAAQAITEDLQGTSTDVNVTTVDFMEYLFPQLNTAIYGGFNFVVSRCASVYNYLNKAAGKYGDVPLKRALTRKIDCLLALHEPDLIISTLPICGQYISAYKARRCCRVPLYTYVTDITLHEEWIAAGTDLYFVGDSSTKNALISRGVSPSKILISGIPVRKAFRPHLALRMPYINQPAQSGQPAHNSNSGARSVQALRSAQAAQPVTRILIMGGGLGLIPGGNELLKTMNDMPFLSVTLIAGKNEKLEREAREKYPNIRVIGFTTDVAQYMQEAQLIITKPGGITTFEAIATRTPLYIVHPFLEQEKGNARFIESNNIGRVIWDKQADVAADLFTLLDDRELLQMMARNMDQLEASFSPVNPLEYYMEREMEKCC